MARTLGPKKINRYTVEFKLTAVKLSKTPGVKVNDIAEALDIHPFMLSRWRKEARDGVLRPVPRKPTPAARAKPKKLAAAKTLGPSPSEMQQFATLRRKHELLKEEHEILKKAIRFCSERRATSSRS